MHPSAYVRPPTRACTRSPCAHPSAYARVVPNSCLFVIGIQFLRFLNLNLARRWPFLEIIINQLDVVAMMQGLLQDAVGPVVGVSGPYCQRISPLLDPAHAIIGEQFLSSTTPRVVRVMTSSPNCVYNSTRTCFTLRIEAPILTSVLENVVCMRVDCRRHTQQGPHQQRLIRPQSYNGCRFGEAEQLVQKAYR